jgi:hypothetical protein
MEYNLSKLLRGDRKLETTRDQPGPDRLASVQCLFRIPFQSSGSPSLKTQTRQAGLEEGMELTSIPPLSCITFLLQLLLLRLQLLCLQVMLETSLIV